MFEADFADRTQDADRVGRIGGDVDQIRLGRLHRANDRREVDRGRRIGPVVDDVDPSRLGVLARAFRRLVLEFGVGGDDRDRLRLRVLRRRQIEPALGEGLHRLGAEGQHREVFRIMELVVGRQREQAEEQPVVRDRDRHRRHDKIGAVARNQQVDLVDVDQLRVDGRHQRRVALVVVIDQLDRPAEQAALGIDLVFPDLESEQPGLADDRKRAGQFHAEADLDRLRRPARPVPPPTPQASPAPSTKSFSFLQPPFSQNARRHQRSSAHARLASSAAACFRSAVLNPSVNQP